MIQNNFDNMTLNEAYEYAAIYGPTPEVEKIISSCGRHPFWYSEDILHDRFSTNDNQLL